MAEKAGSISFEIKVEGGLSDLKKIGEAFKNVGKQAGISATEVNKAGKETENLAKKKNSLNDSLKAFVKQSQKATNEFSKLGHSIRKTSAIIGGLYAGSIFGLDKFLSGTVELTNTLQNLSSVTGISATSLQTFARAGKLVGVSTEESLSKIANLQKRLTDIKMGRGDALPFMRLGIDPYQTKTAIGAMKQINDVMKNIPDFAKGGILDSLGLDANFLRIMNQSSEGLMQLQKFGLSNKEIQQVNKMGDSIRKLKVGFVDLKNKAIAQIAPILKDSLDKTFMFLIKNGDKIVQALSSITLWIGRFAEAIGRVGMYIGGMISNLTKSKNAFKGLAIGIGILVASLSPLTTGIVALLLLLDDIAVWRMGGKSLFGDFYSSIDKFMSKIGEFAAKLGLPGIADFIEKMGGVETVLLGVAAAIGVLKAANILSVLTPLKSLVNFISGNAILFAGLTAIAGIADFVLRKDKSLLGKVLPKTEGNKEGGWFETTTKSVLSNQNLAPSVNNIQNTNNANSTSSSQSRNITNNINLSVNSAKEGREVLSDVLSQTEMDTIYNSYLVSN